MYQNVQKDVLKQVRDHSFGVLFGKTITITITKETKNQFYKKNL